MTNPLPAHKQTVKVKLKSVHHAVHFIHTYVDMLNRAETKFEILTIELRKSTDVC